MKLDNFVVRPQRRLVEKFAKAEPWQALGPDDFNDLANGVADLPTEFVDDDE